MNPNWQDQERNTAGQFGGLGGGEVAAGLAWTGMAGAVIAPFIGLGQQFAGPIIQSGIGNIRLFAGFNGVARDRELLYRSNLAATAQSNEEENAAIVSDTGPFGKNRQAIRFGVEQAIRRFNQIDWNAIAVDSPAYLAAWRWLRNTLRYDGIRIALPWRIAEDGSGIGGGGERAPTDEEIHWTRLIDMQSTPAPLANIIRGFYRSKAFDQDTQRLYLDELNFNLARAQIRRDDDKKSVLQPFAAWSAQDALRLVQSGVIEPNVGDSLIKASGIVNQNDRSFFNALSGAMSVGAIVNRLLRGYVNEEQAEKLLALAGVLNRDERAAILRGRWQLPDIATLQQWNVRNIFDDALADRYGLDGGFAASPAATFFMRTLGAGTPPDRLPGQNLETPNWAALAHRSMRPMPDFGLASILQHRLRPAEVERENSPVFGLPAWDEDNTRDMLRVAGYTDEIADRLMGLVYEPLNIRLINHVLTPMATHPEVARVATEVMGHPTDWIKRAMLDHGFEPGLASVAAAGILAQADDRANAERIEHEKRLRQENRDSWLKQYRLGTQPRLLTRNSIIDKFYTAAMADQEMAIIDAEFDNALKIQQIKTLHESWLTGKLDAGTIAATLTNIGITDDRKQQYLDEWTWERTEKTRMLSTQEVLAQLKSGLMSAPIAQARLVNLGWSAPDALLEVALVEQELSTAAAKTAHATAARADAENRRAQTAAIREERQHEREQAKAQAEAEKTAHAVQLAGPEQLAASAEYAEKIHRAQAAYATAEKSGNSAKEQAALAAAVADYEHYLIQQIKLRQQGEAVQHEVGRMDTPVAPASQPGTQLSVPAQPAVPGPSEHGSGGAGAAAGGSGGGAPGAGTANPGGG